MLNWKEEAREKYCFLEEAMGAPKLELTQALRHLVPFLPHFSNQVRLNTLIALNFLNSLSGPDKPVLGFFNGRKIGQSIR